MAGMPLGVEAGRDCRALDDPGDVAIGQLGGTDAVQAVDGMERSAILREARRRQCG